MGIPSKTKQIAEIQKLLDAALDREDLTTEDLAAEIVSTYHRLLQSNIKKGVPHLHVGLAFKSPYSAKVFHVAWSGGGMIWLVAADSRFGWFASMPEVSLAFPYFEESSAKAGAPGNNPHWAIGDVVSRGQRMHTLKVIATGDKCVLLQGTDGTISPESNDNMTKYYTRERE